MNLCVVTHCYPLYEGDLYGNFLLDFLNALRKEGFRVVVLTPEMHGTRPRLRSECVRTFPWRGGQRRLGELKPYRLSDVLSLPSLFRQGVTALVDLIHREEIDFCLAAWAVPGGVLCRRAWLKTRIPYAVWCLGSDIHEFGRRPILKQLVRKTLRDSTCLFANSRGLARDVNAFVGRTPGFMPTNRILPISETRMAELPSGRQHLLFVGRLEPVKGVDLLIRAVAHLLSKGGGIDLHVLGDGSLRKKLERDVDTLGLRDRVFFEGMVNAPTVTAYMKACDLLVIPSREEGMPVVFHEAMQAGKPVVATDVGDLGWIIRDFEVGVVARTICPEGIAEAISAALGKDLDLSKRAPEVCKEFDIQASARTFTDAVRSIKPLGGR